MDKLTAMQVFVRVVESGSLSKAASIMNLPNSKITRLLQTLESELQVKLLNRSTRALTVTPEGAAYYEGAMDVLQRLSQLESSTFGAVKTPVGQARVELPSSIAYNLIIPLLPLFFDKYPGVRLDLNVNNKSVDLISENVDCAIRLGPILNDSLVARHIGDLRLVAFASRAYLNKAGTPLQPADIQQGHTLIQVISPTTGRAFVEPGERDGAVSHFEGHGFVSVNDSTAAMVSAAAGLGIAITYEYLARAGLADGSLVRIFPEWTFRQIPVHVVYPANRHLANKVRVFIDWLLETLPPQTGQGQGRRTVV